MIIERDGKSRHEGPETAGRQDIQPAPIAAAELLNDSGQNHQIKKKQQPIDRQENRADDRVAVFGDRPAHELFQQPVLAGGQCRQERWFA